MCGRYTVFTEEEIIEMNAIIAEIGKKYGENAVSALKTDEIFPANLAPVLIMERDRLTPKPAVWGFPKWDGKGRIINARAETALERPMFRKPLLERRCVIPSTGFYEWKSVEGKKKKAKYLLRLPDSQMLYMAGMTNVFQDAAGNPYAAYCILTTAASKSVKEIHDRMPVILTPDERETWLTDDNFMRHVLERSGPELVLIF